MKLMLFMLPNGDQVMGDVRFDSDNLVSLQNPITIVIENPMSTSTAVYTSRFSPLSKDNLVTFDKRNIVCFSLVDDNLEKHYKSMVEFYNSKDYKYTSDREVDQAVEEKIKSKFVH